MRVSYVTFLALDVQYYKSIFQKKKMQDSMQRKIFKLVSYFN